MEAKSSALLVMTASREIRGTILKYNKKKSNTCDNLISLLTSWSSTKKSPHPLHHPCLKQTYYKKEIFVVPGSYNMSNGTLL